MTERTKSAFTNAMITLNNTYINLTTKKENHAAFINAIEKAKVAAVAHAARKPADMQWIHSYLANKISETPQTILTFAQQDIKLHLIKLGYTGVVALGFLGILSYFGVTKATSSQERV